MSARMARDSGQMDAALAAARTFCESRIPEELRGEVRLEASRRGRSITIHELRPAWDPNSADPDWIGIAVAQLRRDHASSTWSLYWHDSSERWHRDEGIGPARTVVPLLNEIDRDPTGIFWG